MSDKPHSKESLILALCAAILVLVALVCHKKKIMGFLKGHEGQAKDAAQSAQAAVAAAVSTAGGESPAASASASAAPLGAGVETGISDHIFGKLGKIGPLKLGAGHGKLGVQDTIELDQVRNRPVDNTQPFMVGPQDPNSEGESLLDAYPNYGATGGGAPQGKDPRVAQPSTRGNDLDDDKQTLDSVYGRAYDVAAAANSARANEIKTYVTYNTTSQALEPPAAAAAAPALGAAPTGNIAAKFDAFQGYNTYAPAFAFSGDAVKISPPQTATMF